MAEITKIKKGIIVECDCGATHKITLDENKEIKVKSTYKKKEKEEDENKNRKPENKKTEDGNDDDDDDTGIFF